MNDQTLASVLEQIAEDALTLATLLRTEDRNGKNLAARMADAQVGHLRSPSFEAGSGGAGADEGLSDELRGRTNYSDPTGTAGVQVATNGDRARDDLARLRKEPLHASKVLRRLVEDAGRYSPRAANILERQQEEEPGCQSCSRVPSPGSVGLPKTQRTPWWNPVARNVNVGDKNYALCEWCRVQVRQTGELPAEKDVESYRDGVRVKRKTA